MEALRQHRLEDVRALLAHAAVDMNEKTANGSTALSAAADAGNVAAAQRLIETATDVTAQRDNGEPILLRAVGRASGPGRSTAFVELFP
jgi:ankyrin repeat protein